MDAKINRTNPAIKAPRILGAFYLLLSLAACAIPFALAQRDMASKTASSPATSSESSAGTAPLAMPKFSTGGVLWDQYNHPATEQPINIGSQDFEPAFDALDDQAADDFVLPDPWAGFQRSHHRSARNG